VPDTAANCPNGVVLSWSEYQTSIGVISDPSVLGLDAATLSTDYAWGFSAVGLGFVLSFPIAYVLKAIKLL